ncbi:helix-turn-helix domain-containing protein [Streptomyces sp. NPDC090112]|uniref:helix-turn-helix domain-containing protein n=1 Tax=Streptomyces sp. NPDC090112 TaxID=3365949 RepID=UPI00381598B7
MSVEALTYAARVKVGDITAKFVLGRLADRADERFSCFPSVPLIAAEAEKSERTIQRALAYLEKLRLLSTKEAFREDGSQTSNRFFLHGPWDDYAGTGEPFPEIVTPKQKRALLWAQQPQEGEFREGSAAAVALSGSAELLAASAEAAAEALREAVAVQERRSSKGRKASAAARAKAAPQPPRGKTAGHYGVSSMTPPPVSPMTPSPVSPVTPLEPTYATPSDEGPDGGSAVGQSAGGFTRAGAREGAAPESPTAAGGSAADPEKSAATGEGQEAGGTAPAVKPKKRPARKPVPVSELRPVAGEAEVYGMLDALRVLSSSAARIPTLRRAVREYLGHYADARSGPFAMYPRSPEHAAVRLRVGWHQAGGPERSGSSYRGCDQCTAFGCPASRQECDRILRPAGYLATLFQHQECEHPNCELGWFINTGEDCNTCEYRAAERIRQAKATQFLAESEARAAAAEAERLRLLPAEREAAHGEALEEHAKREEAAARRAARQAAAAAEAEETARLRAELAEQFAELDAAAAVRLAVPAPLDPAHDDLPADQADGGPLPGEEDPFEPGHYEDGSADEEAVPDPYAAATGPSAEYLAWKAQRDEARARQHAERVTAAAGR